MKKILRSFVMMALLAVPFVTQAQVTCDNGTLTTVANAETGSSTSSYLPGYSLYNYSYSEVIIPAGSIELASYEVKALQFKPASTSAGTYFTNCDVYLCNTTQENLSAGFVQDLANFTLVYTGDLNYTTTDWQTVVFTNSFQWDGSSNILVAVHRKHGGWTSGSSFQAYSADAQLARYVYQDSGPYTIGSITGGTATSTVALYHLVGCATNPTCMRVRDVEASNITTDGLTLTWLDTANSGATYTIYDMSDSSVVATNVSATTYTISGLNANTAYTFGVEVNCSATDNSSIATVTTRTACGINTVPYSTGIEGIADGALPYCWDTLATGHNSGGHVFPTAYPYASNAHSGSVYFEFEASNGETEIAVLPEFDTPISGLQLNFWACATNIANFVFEVGVVESGLFVVYDTVAITQSSSFSSSNYHYYQVFFNEYTGSGNRIALRVTPAGTATSYTFFMDDIEVTEFGGCFPIENLAVSNIGSSSVTLTWHDASNSGATYTVYDMADTSVVETAINDTTVTITNLTPNTQYTLAVVADCSSLGESDAVTASFRTNCATEAFPWSEDFDNWTSKSICWSFMSGAFTGGTPTASSSAWTLNSSYGNYITISGKALTMNVYSTYRYWAVTPAIAVTSDNAMLSVDVAVAAWSAATPNYDADDTLAFAISTDGGTTFTTLAVYDNTQLNALTGNYTTLSVPVTGYNNQDVRFAIFAGSSASGGDNRIAIDNIAVMEVPTCFPVAGLTVSAVTDNSVSLTWNDTINTGATYTVYNMADTSVIAANVSATNYTVTGLAPNTSYTFGIEVNCSATDVARIMTVSTRTDCGVEMLPFTEDFSASLSSDPCWRGASNATAAQVFNGTALNLVAPSSWSFTSSTRCGLDGGHYYKNVYGSSVKSWMITPAIDLSTTANAQLSFDVALTDYSNAALPDDNGDTNTSQAFMVIISTDGGNTWDSTNATIWQNVGGDYTYASLASLTYQNKVIDLSQYAGDTIKIAFYCQSLWSGGDNDLHIDNIAVTAAIDTTAPVLDSVTLVTAVNNPTMGTIVPAPGTYRYALTDSVHIEATPFTGYNFIGWNMQFTFMGTTFDSTIYTTVNTLDGTLDAVDGMVINLTALFSGDTTAPGNTYTVTATVNDTTMGDVFGDGMVYSAGDTAFVWAFPNSGYRFVNWTSGTNVVSTDNPYEFVITSDVTLVANFEADSTISADSLTIITAVNDATMGTITPAPGIHRYAEGDIVTITATPNAGYYFGGWIMTMDLGFFVYTDTVIGAPATFSDTATSDDLGMVMEYTALFTADSVPIVNPDSIIVTLAVNNANMGTITPAPGTYTYTEADSIHVIATAFAGYQFIGWNIQGNYYGYGFDTTIYTNVSTLDESFEDMGGAILTVTALFAVDTNGQGTTYTVTVTVNDATMGSVSGAGTYNAGSTVSITATANNGYSFVGWVINGDTITANPYTFTITSDVNALAVFVANNGIEDADMANVTVYGAESRIVVRGAEGKDVYVFDLNGRMVASQLNAAAATEFRMASTGVYLVKVGNAPAKRVLVVR